MKRESRPHGERPFTYHPHKIDDPATFADNYDRIFKKGKYAEPKEQPQSQDTTNENTTDTPAADS